MKDPLKVKQRKKITKKEIKRLAKKERNKLDKEWKLKLRKEFNNTCAITNCGRKDIIHCHHLLPRELKQFRHEILNGICLCPLHHKFSIEISPHRNPIIFFNWYLKTFKDRYDKLYSLYLNIYK